MELKSFLDDRAACYERPEFIDSDPVQIPHQFSRKEDIEIAAFLTATISWGQRKSIIHNANRLMELMPSCKSAAMTFPERWSIFAISIEKNPGPQPKSRTVMQRNQPLLSANFLLQIGTMF